MDYCPYSVNAAKLASSQDKKHINVKASKNDTLYEKISKGRTTIPVVYVDGKYIGGFTEYESYAKNAKKSVNVLE